MAPILTSGTLNELGTPLHRNFSIISIYVFYVSMCSMYQKIHRCRRWVRCYIGVVDLVLVYSEPLDLMKKTKN